MGALAIRTRCAGKLFDRTGHTPAVSSVPRPLRIAFFGLPLAAILLARDGHEIALASICLKDALGLRRARRELGADRVLVKPDATSPKLLQRVRALEPDLLVSWFWTKRLPMSLVGAARLGGIGVHPSLLPRHRGPDPTAWAILEGDPVTGVTVHRIAEEYDTGEILDREEIPIDPAWNAWQLACALDRPSLRALRRAVQRFARGEPVMEMPQDERLATQAPQISDEEAAIQWSWSTARVVRHVRALAPTPGAWTEIAGRPVTLLEVAPATRFPADLAPGEGFAEHGRAVVRTGDGAVVLLQGEIEGTPARAEALAQLFLADAPLLG
jgi:methionyl-tRNA formyltransferase